MSELLRITNATVRVGLKPILISASLAVEPGQVWAFVGPNGSGKTTLAELIAGIREPASGTIDYRKISAADIQMLSFEQQLRLIAAERRKESSWLMHGATDPGTTVREYLDSAPGNADVTSLQHLRIGHILDRGLRFLSTGEIRKVILARALAGDPELLILDDPFDGLDVDARGELTKLLDGLPGQGMTVILVLGHESEASEAVTHLARLESGRVVAAGPRESQVPSKERSRVATGSGTSGVPERDDTVVRIPGDWDGGRKVPAEIIHMAAVSVSYGSVPVLRNVDWTVQSGESWQVVGPNGAGKTTLLSLVTGSNPKAYGQDIRLFGVTRGSGESVWQIKKRIGIVSGDFHHGYPLRVTAVDAILSGFTDSMGMFEKAAGYQLELARAWLDLIGLADHERLKLKELSYGQQRAVFVARAMVKRPPLLIADEPCQGLDDLHSRTVLSLLDRISRDTPTTLIYVSHNPNHLLKSTNRRLALEPDPAGSTAHTI